jgi:hypothetical protein
LALEARTPATRRALRSPAYGALNGGQTAARDEIEGQESVAPQRQLSRGAPLLAGTMTEHFIEAIWQHRHILRKWPSDTPRPPPPSWKTTQRGPPG